ncbi:MAG: T9SS type A sorting domain-containing protein [Calditrichia bacterium]
MQRISTIILATLITACFSFPALSQDDAMMQAFYWDVPVDATTNNGTWWDNLSSKSSELKNAGITGIWVPSPSKGNFGIYDMGYGIWDHYDLGNYNQKGTTETRFGSRAELESMISTMHQSPKIEVYADIVLNHLYTSEDEREANPAVKQYVYDHAYRNGTQYQSYPTNEIVWTIPNAGTGDYYIQIKGYLLDWVAANTVRGYDLQIDWTGAGSNGTPSWESEPNNGGGQFNNFPGSGQTVRAHIENASAVDEYKITLSSSNDIEIRLTARFEDTSSGSWEWAWASQNNGYYPAAVWHNGSNLANSTLEAQTNTGINYVTHTGTGEANHSWTYSDFHPVDNSDWLGYPGSDEIITNTKFFGNDINTFSTTVQNRLNDWGYWMADEIGFDGFRLDFVRGFQESYVADWVNNLPKLNGSQRFIVGEYWGADYRIRDWVNAVATNNADVDGFDFPLKFTLTGMTNGNQSSFDMKNLNNAGMVRNNQGNGLPGTSIVTFVDNHDTGKEHDKWVTKDWDMAYAYTVTHEGRPCIFYSHFYGVTQVDAHNSSYTVTPPSSLKDDLKKLIHVRKNYLGGGLTVLSDVGNPWPSGDTYHVYAARRAGNGTRDGAIVVINNHDSQTKGLWVDSSPSGWGNWANTTLVNAFDNTQTTQVYGDGRVYVSAPARGYAVYVKQSDYLAYSKVGSIADNGGVVTAVPAEFSLLSNYPNPFNPQTTIRYQLPSEGRVKVDVFNALGQHVIRLVDEDAQAGSHSMQWDAREQPSGVYFLSVQWQGVVYTQKMMLMK